MSIEGAEIVECWHGSPEWIEARLGIVTASSASKIMAGGEGKTRGEYLRKLAGEEVSRVAAEGFKSKAMERGNEMESHIRSLYSLVTGREVLPISVDDELRLAPDSPGHGFVKRIVAGRPVGASPDGKVFDAKVMQTGGAEFKSHAPHLLIEIMKRGVAPAEHIPQCQLTMLVTGWPWVDLTCGYRGMPPFVRRVRRDTAAIARMEEGLRSFHRELDELVAWVRAYKD